jgi:predicted O-methyltransferase YrrM
LLELGRSYQGAAVLAAAAELDVFAALAKAPLTAEETARRLDCGARGLTVLLDALAALGLLWKQDARYALPPGGEELLTAQGAQSILAMAQHQANCLRNWSQLAEVIKTDRPAPRRPSIRGEQGDAAAFVGAMHNICAPSADQVIQALASLPWRHLLDVGGASGTWTLAFLRACPAARATLFDLPHVIPMARARLAAAGVEARIRLVAGDFMTDQLPGEADLAWVSAIVHQNSRAQNRQLFANVLQALRPGGRLAIRDFLMNEDRTEPVAGALFALNMLVATEGGGTYTAAELEQDLQLAGFAAVSTARLEPTMNSILLATKGAD